MSRRAHASRRRGRAAGPERRDHHGAQGPARRIRHRDRRRDNARSAPCARVRQRARRPRPTSRALARRACAPPTASCSGGSPSELRLKHTPTLEFVYDDTRRPRPMRIQSCLDQERGRVSGATAPRRRARRCSQELARRRALRPRHAREPRRRRARLAGRRCSEVLDRARQGLASMFMAADEFPLPYEYRFFELDGLVTRRRPTTSRSARSCSWTAATSTATRRDALKRDGAHILNIDHHHDNTRFGTVNHVVPEASCTAEIVWDLMHGARRRADAADRRGALRRPGHRHRAVHVREHRPARARRWPPS